MRLEILEKTKLGQQPENLILEQIGWWFSRREFSNCNFQKEETYKLFRNTAFENQPTILKYLRM